MMNLLTRKRVFTVSQFLEYEKLSKGKQIICNIAKDLEGQGIIIDRNNKVSNVLIVTLGLMMYSEKVLAAGDAIGIEPGFWKLVSVIQKIVAALALLYSYRVLAKMAAKGEGSWKEVGYGLMIAAADYALPTAFKFVSGLF